jgi:tetratricopeptide (TPR) repeat protein
MKSLRLVKKKNIRKRRILMVLPASIFLFLLIFVGAENRIRIVSPSVSSQSIENEIEMALFRREEFFGAQAVVPVPTAEAYEKLLKIAETNEPKVFARLAELAEKLERVDEAESYLIKAENPENLANFYQRRGNFVKEAETLERIFKQGKQLDIFERLLERARLHDLDKYLQPEFFQQAAEISNDAFPIIEKLIDQLITENQKTRALKIIRSHKEKFPEKMLAREVALLAPDEAERVYHQSFNPFWPDAQADNFYQFLSDNDRLRAYGRELEAKFRRNPADYETAIRLIHYRQYDYRDQEIAPIVVRLEKNKKEWSADELLTIARLVLKSGDGNLAAKFLYTLQNRNELTPEKRSQISYQIFQILCRAESERLSLTKGDLNFYRDVAVADFRPGITTGILSLVFSDTDPGREFEKKEQSATKLFNRAAAYRFFRNFQNEFPHSPELGQMYLDLIVIYTHAKDTELAAKLISEFETNHEKSSDYPRVAMKLAEAFIARAQPDGERRIYQKVMDFLGLEGKFGGPQKPIESGDKPEFMASRPRGGKYADLSWEPDEPVFYRDVLSRYVESLAKEKKILEILQIYSSEIAKYPDQEWLYEQRLNWLEQTNLYDEQLRAYNSTLEKFPSSNWRDRFARWFIRRDKQAEFEKFSTRLVENLHDQEIESYLAQFTDKTVDILTEKFHFKLYQTAHRRFPHNIEFVIRLLNFYKARKQEKDWQRLAAEYYFASPLIRREFLNELAQKGELAKYSMRADGQSPVHELFRADASLWLSRNEEALQSYRKLNRLYPNDPEIFNHLINLTRSFGQKDRDLLIESADYARRRADFDSSNSVYRTESGEINAQLADYQTARSEWLKLISARKGSSEAYLETATVFWDYFLYDNALQTIRDYRTISNDKKSFSFESGAILDAQHKRDEAIAEYLEALENDPSKAQRRLQTLAAESGVFQQINAIFQRQERSDWKTLSYAELLRDLAKDVEAQRLLRPQIVRSKDTEFLTAVKSSFDELRPTTLSRLAEIATSSKKRISYRLQEADYYREKNRPEEARRILADLQQKFPTNYGVLIESADFYWSLGTNETALRVLRAGLAKARGQYRLAIAARLAERLISIDRLAEAERILVNLHQENPVDADLFSELANVYVRRGKADDLRKSFRESVDAIKKQELEIREIEAEIAGRRRQMIMALTQLKDYRSAVEQHIEIINRDPETDENVEAAVSYVKRYGGADLLLTYYQKTAAEAFRNYRWNVILAKISEAGGNFESAVEQYRRAIDNQPERTELYLELARIETQRRNYAEALKNIDRIIELAGEEKSFLSQKVKLLQLLGRDSEAREIQGKLSRERKPVPHPENQFAEAEKSRSIEMFRDAFSSLLEKPLQNELKAENITSYIEVLRGEEDLDVIADRLFLLREKLITEAQRPDAELAGEARRRLQILDNAVSQTVGNLAKTVGTSRELDKLHHNLSLKIDAVPAADQNGTLTFLQDLAARAGFGDVVEKILILRGNKQSLIEFYNERGAFQKILEIAEADDNWVLTAENARLLGVHEKEIKALRILFQDRNTSATSVLRYLQIVTRAELEALSKQNSPHQLKLINFLLGKGEKELVHQAIEHSGYQNAWKLARHAEVSLALREYDEANECYFCDALKLAPTGELLNPHPDKSQRLVGTDWFRLSRQYGEWLDGKKEPDAGKFLTAMTENLPRDANEQARLGEYYLAKNEPEKARQHFQLSLELDRENTYVQARLGETYWRLNEKPKAETIFGELLQTDPENYFRTLRKLRLQQTARERLLPIVIAKLEADEKIDDLLRLMADSFLSDREKAAFFITLCRGAHGDRLAENIIRQKLVPTEYHQPFYEILVKSNRLAGSDYVFEEIVRRTFSDEVAEEIYDHENDFEAEEIESLKWHREYLEFLLDRGKDSAAKSLILQIEKDLQGKYPRPVWLRLARFQIFGGNMQNIIGIAVTDNVPDPKPPSIERLNAAAAVLRKAKREAEAEKLILDFYARMLALAQNDTANFVGLARQLFVSGRTSEALQILEILANFSEEEKQAELLQMPLVKAFVSQKSVSLAPIFSVSLPDALDRAARLCEEFGQPDSAVKFRESLHVVSPNNSENRLKLAALYPKDRSIKILSSIADERNIPRSIRWKAIWQLHRLGVDIEFPDHGFDTYSQYYNGLLSGNDAYFHNSLLADKVSELQPLRELIMIYAKSDKPFAALKLAEMDQTPKDDELLNLLSDAAKQIGEYKQALEFEKAKSNPDQVKIKSLEMLYSERDRRFTQFVVDAENTRKL